MHTNPGVLIPGTQTPVTYLYNPWDARLSHTKTGRTSLFSCIFMLKTATWVNIPPGISTNICDSGILSTEMETPDLTEYNGNFIMLVTSILRNLFSRFFVILHVRYT